MNKKNVNIKDIAKLAGVGVSTVSRVINNQADVKQATRERVLEIIKEYNYIPNNSARNLKLNATKTIGVLVKGIYNPFFSKIVRSIEMEIAKYDYSMILHYNSKDNCNEDTEAAVEVIKEKNLSGLICLGGYFKNFEDLRLEELNVPIVLCSALVHDNVDPKMYSSVGIDDCQSAKEAVDYIIGQGHKKIGMIKIREDDESGCKFRFSGYKLALEENDIQINKDIIAEGNYSFETGHAAMKKILSKDKNLSAVFVSTDLMAIGATRAILETGLRVPEDISVIGFDGIEFAEYFMPSISTVKQPVEEMGKKSVDMMFGLLDGGENSHFVYKTEIIQRESLKKV